MSGYTGTIPFMSGLVVSEEGGMGISARFKNTRAFPIHIVVFLAPAVIIYTMFMIYPLLDSLRLSLYAPQDRVSAFVDSTSYQEIYVGLDNYERLASDDLWEPRLKGAIKNNLVFFSITSLRRGEMCTKNLSKSLSTKVVIKCSVFRVEEPGV